MFSSYDKYDEMGDFSVTKKNGKGVKNYGSKSKKIKEKTKTKLKSNTGGGEIYSSKHVRKTINNLSLNTDRTKNKNKK